MAHPYTAQEWVKEYPWLWAIVPDWRNVHISAIRIKNASDFYREVRNYDLWISGTSQALEVPYVQCVGRGEGKSRCCVARMYESLRLANEKPGLQYFAVVRVEFRGTSIHDRYQPHYDVLILKPPLAGIAPTWDHILGDIFSKLKTRKVGDCIDDYADF